MEDHTIPAEPVSAASVAAHLEALNLAGLAFAAKRLLGKDPAPVMGQFTMWDRAGQPALPTLTTSVWEAVAPLHIGRPATPSAALCDQVLVGAEQDGQAAMQGAADCASAGKSQFRAAPLPAAAAGSLGGEEIAAVVSQIKDVWRAIGTVYGKVRPLVIAGDHEGASAALTQAGSENDARLTRIAALSAAVAEMTSRNTPAVEEPPVAPDMTAPLQAEVVAPVDQSFLDPVFADVEPLTPATLTDAQAEAFARHEQVTARPEPQVPTRPVEVLSTKEVRNHPFLPVLFLLLVSGVALYVLFSVINNPANPLAQ